MRKYVTKRILLMFLLLLGMSFLVFASLYIAPGDPAELVAGANATPEDISIEPSQKLGIDIPASEVVVSRLSINVSFLIAAIIPVGIPMTKATIILEQARFNVCGKRTMIS